MPKYIFEISLDLKDLSIGEAKSLVEIRGGKIKKEDLAYNGLIIDFQGELGKISHRFGLVREYSRCLEVVEDPFEMDFEKLIRELRGKRYYIEVERDPERYSPNFSKELCAKIARKLKDYAKVSFRDPEVIVKIYLGEKCAIGIKVGERPKEVTKVRGNSFPFTRPVIMDRRIARAMINLTRIREGELFLDPMCGTGTFLLDAGKMGMRVIGADIDDEMVEGAKRNLKHFGVNFEGIFKADIRELPKKVPKVDGIATDPPYGRSSSTFGRSLEELYEETMCAIKEMLKRGKRASIIFPREEDHFEIGAKYLRLLNIYSQRVHKGLTRYIAVYER